MSWKWFQKLTSANLRVIRDCYIAQYDDRSNHLHLLGLKMESDSILDMQYDPDVSYDTIVPIIPGTSSDIVLIKVIIDYCICIAKKMSFLISQAP